MRFRSLVLSLLFLLGTACASVAPTPILIGQMKNLNNEAHALYVDCSTGPNYTPTKEGCDPELLALKVDETRVIAIHFIQADPKQPHGYDVHLSVSLIYFRIDLRDLKEYSDEEDISWQFFKIQEANSGKAIDASRYWLAWYVSSASSQQRFEDPLALTPERKVELLEALTEGTRLLSKEEGPRLVRLMAALDNLRLLIDSIQ
jgi:hypothetical protein